MNPIISDTQVMWIIVHDWIRCQGTHLSAPRDEIAQEIWSCLKNGMITENTAALMFDRLFKWVR